MPRDMAAYSVRQTRKIIIPHGRAANTSMVSELMKHAPEVLVSEIAKAALPLPPSLGMIGE